MKTEATIVAWIFMLFIVTYLHVFKRLDTRHRMHTALLSNWRLLLSHSWPLPADTHITSSVLSSSIKACLTPLLKEKGWCMVYMSFWRLQHLNSNILFSLKQDYGRVGGVDAGPVLCHPCHLILCNSVFLLQNKITLCVCKCVHIWEGVLYRKIGFTLTSPGWLLALSVFTQKKHVLLPAVFPPSRPLKNSSISSALKIVEIPLCSWFFL